MAPFDVCEGSGALETDTAGAGLIGGTGLDEDELLVSVTTKMMTVAIPEIIPQKPT